MRRRGNFLAKGPSPTKWINMYPFWHFRIHMRVDMYPKAAFRVHMGVLMYPFWHFRVHMRTDMYPKAAFRVHMAPSAPSRTFSFPHSFFIRKRRDRRIGSRLVFPVEEAGRWRRADRMLSSANVVISHGILPPSRQASCFSKGFFGYQTVSFCHVERISFSKIQGRKKDHTILLHKLVQITFSA